MAIGTKNGVGQRLRRWSVQPLQVSREVGTGGTQLGCPVTWLLTCTIATSTCQHPLCFLLSLTRASFKTQIKMEYPLPLTQIKDWTWGLHDLTTLSQTWQHLLLCLTLSTRLHPQGLPSVPFSVHEMERSVVQKIKSCRVLLMMLRGDLLVSCFVPPTEPLQIQQGPFYKWGGHRIRLAVSHVCFSYLQYRNCGSLSHSLPWRFPGTTAVQKVTDSVLGSSILKALLYGICESLFLDATLLYCVTLRKISIFKCPHAKWVSFFYSCHIHILNAFCPMHTYTFGKMASNTSFKSQVCVQSNVRSL